MTFDLKYLKPFEGTPEALELIEEFKKGVKQAGGKLDTVMFTRY